jgi:hypothetical protein
MENPHFPLSALVYVVALSDYDLVWYEDNTVNRSLESLSCLEKILKDSKTSNVPLILVFTKRLILQEV